jgi:hypothetical protein
MLIVKLIGFASAGTSLAILAYLCCVPISLPPGISVSNEHIELFSDINGLTSTFSILNGSETSVELQSNSGCSCISVTFSRQYLRSNQVAQCTITVDPSRAQYGAWQRVPFLVNGRPGPKVDFVCYLTK